MAPNPFLRRGDADCGSHLPPTDRTKILEPWNGPAGNAGKGSVSGRLRRTESRAVRPGVRRSTSAPWIRPLANAATKLCRMCDRVWFETGPLQSLLRGTQDRGSPAVHGIERGSGSEDDEGATSRARLAGKA